MTSVSIEVSHNDHFPHSIFPILPGAFVFQFFVQHHDHFCLDMTGVGGRHNVVVCHCLPHSNAMADYYDGLASG